MSTFEVTNYLEAIEKLSLDGDSVSSWRIANSLFNIPRSVSAKGNIETLEILNQFTAGALELKFFHEKKFFSWERPSFWTFHRAQIMTPQGDVLIDSENSLLHVVYHSCPVDEVIDFKDLEGHLHFENDAKHIPYRTTYYKKNWGFCVTYDQYQEIRKHPRLHVRIDSTLEDKPMPYGEGFFKGNDSSREILITSYICHPSMANNELSGVLLVARLMQCIKKLHLAGLLPVSVRFLLAPETVGSIAFINENLDHLRAFNKGVVVCSCVGDGRSVSLVDGRNPGPFCDALNLSASAVAEENNLEFHKYDFLQRGADERQYASPHVDLDVGTLCNSKFGEYPEYHNSSDNLDIISDQALAMSAEIVLRAIGLFACNEKPVMVDPCEPMLSKHGLYPHTRNYSATQEQVMQMLNFAAYADGKLSLIEMAKRFGWTDKIAMQTFNAFKNAELIKF